MSRDRDEKVIKEVKVINDSLEMDTPKTRLDFQPWSKHMIKNIKPFNGQLGTLEIALQAKTHHRYWQEQRGEEKIEKARKEAREIYLFENANGFTSHLQPFVRFPEQNCAGLEGRTMPKLEPKRWVLCLLRGQLHIHHELCTIRVMWKISGELPVALKPLCIAMLFSG